MTTPLDTVLVGFGRIASAYADDPLTARHYRYATHAQVLSDHPAFRWVGVADPRPEALAQARDRWGVPRAAASVEELGRLTAPEAAVLATPPGDRLAALASLPTVRAVLVEKPLGGSRAEAERFLAYCRERGILVQVNYWRRADALFRQFADGLLPERIGPVQAAVCVYGGGLRNNGSHLIDFARMLLGEVSQVAVLGAVDRDRPLPLPGDADVAFMLRLRTGPVVAFTPLDFSRYREIGLDVWGERGRLTVSQEGLTIRTFSAGPHRAVSDCLEMNSDAPEEWRTTVGDAFHRMYGNLAEAARGRAALWSPGESALVTERLVQAVADRLTDAGAGLPDSADVLADAGDGRRPPEAA